MNVTVIKDYQTGNWMTVEGCRKSMLPEVRHEEEEDDGVEEDDVDGPPQAVCHARGEHQPAHHHVVGVQHAAVRHQDTRHAARVAAENHFTDFFI